MSDIAMLEACRLNQESQRVSRIELGHRSALILQDPLQNGRGVETSTT